MTNCSRIVRSRKNVGKNCHLHYVFFRRSQSLKYSMLKQPLCFHNTTTLDSSKRKYYLHKEFNLWVMKGTQGRGSAGVWTLVAQVLSLWQKTLSVLRNHSDDITGRISGYYTFCPRRTIMVRISVDVLNA